MPAMKFSQAKNEKLESMKSRDDLPIKVTGIGTTSLPAGFSCPDAKDCLAKVIMNELGKRQIHDGPDMEFRCFEATMEAYQPNIYQRNWDNFTMLRDCKNDISKMAEIINAGIQNLPRIVNLVRPHIGGDFFSKNYLLAWYQVARNNPGIYFYAYTKSLRFWVATMHLKPDNMELTASIGGRYDNLIEEYNLKSARVVFSEAEAAELGLEIDHDDSLAAFGTESFALELHATQPAGTPAAAAWKEIRQAKQAKKYEAEPIAKRYGAVKADSRYPILATA